MTTQTSASISLRGKVGPVFSHAGFKNWFFFLSDTTLYATPVSFGVTVKAGIWAALGAPAKMTAAYNSVVPPFDAELEDSGDPNWLRFQVASLQKIAVKKCHSANEIIIEAEGAKPMVFGLGDRAKTNEVRALLRQTYPALYQDVGFE